jgi:hypothetical protein
MGVMGHCSQDTRYKSTGISGIGGGPIGHQYSENDRIYSLHLARIVLYSALRQIDLGVIIAVIRIKTINETCLVDHLY